MNGLYVILTTTTAVRITTDNPVSILNGSGVPEGTSGTAFNLSNGAHFIKPDSLNQYVTVTFYDKYSIKVIGTAGGYHANDIELFDDCVFLSSLTQIWTNSGGKLNFDLFKDAPLLNTIYATNLTQCYGNVESLSGITLTSFNVGCANSQAKGNAGLVNFNNSITSINFPQAIEITGNLTDFYGYAIGNLGVAGTSIEGVLEEFLEQWYLLGKTSITLSLPLGVTFHNWSIGSLNWSGRADISEGVLTLKNSSNVLLGTYDGTTWTYA